MVALGKKLTDRKFNFSKKSSAFFPCHPPGFDSQYTLTEKNAKKETERLEGCDSRAESREKMLLNCLQN